MKLIIRRGTHEIGGSCVELCSSSGKTCVVVDIGMPLVTPTHTPFEWDKYKSFTEKQLVDQRILPGVEGLYSHQKRRVSAVLISHAHQDHYGFLRFVNPSIPIYVSAGTKSLLEISNIFLNTAVNLDHMKTFSMQQPFQIGEFTVTPYLMDHSAPDAAAFLIEGDGKRLFYTGDFRGHGRKRILLQRLLEKPINGIDCLIMEGTMMGRGEGAYPDEDAVEKAIRNALVNQQSYAFIFCSSQNLDRLASIYRAVIKARKTLVIDLYTAFVLDKLNLFSLDTPQFKWSNTRILYAYSHAQKLAEYDKNLLYKYRKAKINWDEIMTAPQNIVILSKDNRYFRKVIHKLDASCQSKIIYSMWHGYLERTDLVKVARTIGMEITEIHTGGHAYTHDLRRLVNAMNPYCLVPIHTFFPEDFKEFHTNVIQLKDGQAYYLK